MFITRVDQKIETSDTTGKTKITLEIEVDNSNFISEEAVGDEIISHLVDQYLIVTSAFITNILHFYKESPVLATYVLGSTLKEVEAKNKYYRSIAKQLASENKKAPD